MKLDVDGDLTQMGTPTDAPKVGPTMPPAFNLHDFARDSSRGRGLVVTAETVLELVPDVSITASNLDLLELSVIRQIDGVSPVALLESAVVMSRDELEVMLAMLMARGLVRVARDAADPRPDRVSHVPVSGVFGRQGLALEDDAARTG